MGAIHRFNLNNYIEEYNLDNYIELGYGDCTSFKYAIDCNFKQWYGVDLDRDFYNQAKWIEDCNYNVHLVCDYSVNALNKWSKEIIGNTLWFNDSHFAGTPDYGKCSYEDSIKNHKRDSLPLEDELDILIKNRDISKDVIIIDDFFLYAGDDLTEWSRQNPFKYRNLVNELGIDLSPEFIYDKLEGTHNIEIDIRDQGYLIATPKL